MPSAWSRAGLVQGYDDFRAYCNRFLALHAELGGELYRLVAVRDGKLVDQDGRACEDFLAGWGTQAFGHRNAAIENAVRQWLDSDTPSFFTSGVSPYAGTFARELCERANGAYGASFFANGGTEAVEAAMKLARATTKRTRILGIEGAFHGCTMGSVAMMAPGDYRDPFAPHLPHVQALPFGDVARLEQELASGEAAAIVVEPIQVESGVRTPPPEWISAVCELTERHGTLLVADEVLTGMGRTGHFLATETWPRRPDVVVMGKALGGGLVPVSCILTRRDVFDRAYGTHTTAEGHGSTFSGNALACVAGLAALSLLDEDLLARVRSAGTDLASTLREALADLPLVEEVRGGHGLLVGIRLRQPDHPAFTFDSMGMPELTSRPSAGLILCHRLARAGFIVAIGAHDWLTVRVHPALTTPDERLHAFVRTCQAEVRFLCEWM